LHVLQWEAKTFIKLIRNTAGPSGDPNGLLYAEVICHNKELNYCEFWKKYTWSGKVAHEQECGVHNGRHWFLIFFNDEENNQQNALINSSINLLMSDST
jgi:hypothetical protein